MKCQPVKRATAVAGTFMTHEQAATWTLSPASAGSELIRRFSWGLRPGFMLPPAIAGWLEENELFIQEKDLSE